MLQVFKVREPLPASPSYFNDDACGLRSQIKVPGNALSPGAYCIVVDGYSGATEHYEGIADYVVGN
jgi:hypothetical protein